jgi:hypothetical protein
MLTMIGIGAGNGRVFGRCRNRRRIPVDRERTGKFRRLDSGLSGGRRAAATLGVFPDAGRHERYDEDDGSWRRFAYLASIISQTLLLASIFRATLGTPEQGLFHLRLGVRELWLGLALLTLLIAMFIGFFVLMIPMFVVAGIMAATQATSWAGLIPILGLLIVSVAIWVGLRMSMAPLMSFRGNSFFLFESWSFTRGHAGKMFAVAFALSVICWALELVLVAVGFVALNSVEPLAGLFQQLTKDPAAALASLKPGVVSVIAILMALFSTVLWVLFAAAWAEIYRSIAPTEAQPV